MGCLLSMSRHSFRCSLNDEKTLPCSYQERERDRQTGRQADRQTGRQAGRQADRQNDSQRHSQPASQPDSQTARQTDSQTDRLTHTHRLAGVALPKKNSKYDGSVPNPRV